MQIRKVFKFEAAHRVRSSTGSRCRESIHGHSYIVEVFLTSIDYNDMVLDFGDLKKAIGDFFDCLDHATFIWEGDDHFYKESIYKFSKRVIRMRRDPTAENMARAFLKVVLNHTATNFTGMLDAVSTRVRVHETATGYAEACPADLTADDLIFVDHPNDD